MSALTCISSLPSSARASRRLRAVLGLMEGLRSSAQARMISPCRVQSLPAIHPRIWASRSGSSAMIGVPMRALIR